MRSAVLKAAVLDGGIVWVLAVVVAVVGRPSEVLSLWRFCVRRVISWVFCSFLMFFCGFSGIRRLKK